MFNFPAEPVFHSEEGTRRPCPPAFSASAHSFSFPSWAGGLGPENANKEKNHLPVMSFMSMMFGKTPPPQNAL